MQHELKEHIAFITNHPSIEEEEVYNRALRALTLSQKLHDQEGIILTKWAIAHYRMSKGEYVNAEQLLQELLELVDQHQSKYLKGRVLSALGALNYKYEKYHRSLDYSFEALKYVDEFWASGTYNTIGLIYKEQKQFDRSNQYFQNAIQKAKRVKNHRAHVAALLNYARNKMYQNRDEEAIVLLKDVVQFGEQHFKRGKLYGLLNLGKLAHKKQHLQEAIIYCDQLLDLSKKEKFIYEKALGLKLKGQILLDQESTAGLTFLEEAKSIAEIYGYEQLLLVILDYLIEYYEQANKTEKVLLLYRQSNALYQKLYQEKERSNLKTLLNSQEKQILLLERQKNKIAKQNQELKQYAYIVAHDLKEPLRNISSFAALFEKRYKDLLDEKGLDYLGFITNGTTHMHHLLEDLLVYATLDNLKSQQIVVPLGDIIEDIIIQSSNEIEALEAEINIQALPEIIGIPAHFKQIFQNLIHNALKFHHSERTPKIEVGVKVVSTHYQFHVSDNGIGIEPDYHDLIFKIFKRLDKQHYKGTGIGLAICKKIVELYDGAIWIESNKNKGSKFIFSIHQDGLIH